MIKASFKGYEKEVEKALLILDRERVIERIWKKDWTLWKTSPQEIANRLGWLTAPRAARKILPSIDSLVTKVREEGYDRVLLLGMGGSSLAPLVLSSTFRTKPGFLGLKVLDSTIPSTIWRIRGKIDPSRTLFIVSSKSGTTMETMALFRYFWNEAVQSLGQEKAGRHFVAITDENSPLAEEAGRLGFRSLFLGDPDIGGRFSALSPFGLVPGALMGLNLARLVRSAEGMAEECREVVNLRVNPGALLGTALAVMVERGRDKLTLFLPPRLESFGLWLEQLVAESTGKEGKGIVPVHGEPPLPELSYGEDRFFVLVTLRKATEGEAMARGWQKANLPYVVLHLDNAWDLGGQFFLWEFAIAVAGQFLKINPFNQPDVDSTKKKTLDFLKTYQEKRRWPEEMFCLEQGGVRMSYESRVSSIAEGWRSFLGRSKAGDYIALQAFLPTTPAINRALGELRLLLGEKTGLAVTSGYGPRYLHSTGQLHKGGSNRGLFVLLAAEPGPDIPVPDEPGSSCASLTFGELSMAQALADGAALRAAHRRLIRFDLGRQVAQGLRRIHSAVQEVSAPSFPGRKTG